MVRYGRPRRSSRKESVRSSFGRTVKGKAIWENPIQVRLGEGFQLGMLIRTPSKRIILISVCGWHKKLAGKKQNIDPMWKVLNKEVDLGEPTSLLDHVFLGCTQRECQISKGIVAKYRDMFESRISACAKEKLPTRASGKPDEETISSWSYDIKVLFYDKRNVIDEVNLTHAMTWKVTQRNVWKDMRTCK